MDRVKYPESRLSHLLDVLDADLLCIYVSKISTVQLYF